MLISLLIVAFLAAAGLIAWLYRVDAKSATPTGKLAFVKDVASALQSLFTIGALIAAGWWFYTNRQNKPRIKIEHIVSQRPDLGEAGNTFMGIEVKVTNIGNVGVDLSQGEIEVAECNPEAVSLEKDQPTIVALEPGESDQLLFRKILIESKIKTLEVRTKLNAPEGFHWVYRSLIDVDQSPSGHGSSTSSSGLDPVTQPIIVRPGEVSQPKY